MSNDLITQNDQDTPFPRAVVAASPSINAGAVAIEQERAIAEARGQMQLAKMFPRDLNAVYAEVMNACKLQSLANVAFYSVPRGGKSVTGPSIKLIEQIAASCEHFEWGHREIGRIEATATSFGRSEIEVYAWDKQKNTRSIRQITVLHVLDTRDGPRKLRDQKDIDDKIANVASKQMRGRIQAILPKWLVEAAIEECKKTLAGTNTEPMGARVRRMTMAFANFGVTPKHIENRVNHSLDTITIDELADLQGIYNALKDGERASEYFQIDGESEPVEQKNDDAAKAIADASAGNAQQQSAAPAQRQRPTARPRAAAPAAKPDEKSVNQAKDEPANPVENEPQAQADQTVKNQPKASQATQADNDMIAQANAEAAASASDADDVF